VPPGEIFWYENSIGLAEIAANSASAAERLGLTVGSAVGLASE
jgi:S-adenosylmethionine hydrolase